MATMNRRDFLRNVGIASAASATACTYSPKVPAEHVLPYVVQPEDELPGTATYFSTACTGCANACGLVARSKEGRVVMVEGNPDHPSGPGLCARGHFDLLATYSPDRLQGPSADGKPLTWDDATASVVAGMKAATAAGKTIAWLGQYRTGSLASLLAQVSGVSALRRVHWEPLGVETLVSASRAVFGIDAVPTFDLSGAHVIVSFGMDFLGTSFDSMALAKGWADARNPAKGGFVTRLVCVEPRVGVTSSQADNFLPPTPGTEARVALALARLVAEARHYEGPATALLASVDVAAEASASGITEEKLREVAGWIASGPSAVLPGGHANAGADGTALAIATFILNEVAGNVGRSLVFGREGHLGQVNSYADVQALLDDAVAGKIGLLFIDGVNPVYNLPGGAGVIAALDAVDVVVQLANERDDSTRPKTLLLPPGTGLESWGDAEVLRGVHVLQQAAMLAPVDQQKDAEGKPSRKSPDLRCVGDVLLAIGRGIAAPPAAIADVAIADVAIADAAIADAAVTRPMGFEYAAFKDYVKERWRREVYAGEAGGFDDFWRAALQRGGYFASPAPTGAAFALAALPQLGGPIAGAGLALVIFPSPLLGDGRHANVPWAQELPDPITTYTWTSWAEINPRLVASLGLGPTDTVKVKNGQGEIIVPYFSSPGVREDTVAVVLGNGHADTGRRYARARGVNPMPLLPAGKDAVSGALALYATRVEVTRSAALTDAVAAIGHPNQDGRPFANLVTVSEAVENLKGAPGSSVHLHVLPVDKRLVEAGMLDMYPEPQHPTYRFAMAIDTNACNGCMACVAACNLENNIAFVGPDQSRKGRNMRWIRMDRFWEGEGEHQDVRYLPAICQHCAHAPCEGVCPVLATYHNLDGLNAMIYNRCVGTRYCANNCPYTARRFNYHTWEWPVSMHLMLNPDVSPREMGVMEKCTFCIQRTRAVKDSWRDVHETVPDSALVKLTACASACPTDAITFGNAKDPDGVVSGKFADPRAYTLLGELNTKPGVRYLARVRHDIVAANAHGEGHADTKGAAGEGHKEG